MVLLVFLAVLALLVAAFVVLGVIEYRALTVSDALWHEKRMTSSAGTNFGQLPTSSSAMEPQVVVQGEDAPGERSENVAA